MSAPDALLYLSSQCPHCPTALTALTELVKAGQLGRLDVVNLTVHPDAGAALGVQAVPWVRIGRIELAGAHSRAEYAEWTARVARGSGVADWFHELLKAGQLARVEAAVAAEPELLAALLPILANVDASLNVRLGAGVVFETHAGTAALVALVAALGELAAHADARVRADACHVLGLTGAAAARNWLDARRDDPDPDVREIVAESLAALPT